MIKIGIVYNPFAGKNKKKGDKRIKELEKILGKRGLVRKTTSIQEIYNTAQEFYNEKVDILGISGGDGTNHCVLTKFLEVYREDELPHILLLRGGTMNLLESSLGIKGTPESRLKKLIKLLDNNNKIPIKNHTLLKVNNKYGFIFGNGLIANFMGEYYKGGDAGPLKAMKVFLKACCSCLGDKKYAYKLFTPIKAKVEVEGKTLPETEFKALMAATEKSCGFGFKPFYKAGEYEGKLHFLAVNMSPTEVVKNLHKVKIGRKVKSKYLYDYLTTKVVIDTYYPYYYTVDGEMLNSTTHIEIMAGPIIKLINI